MTDAERIELATKIIKLAVKNEYKDIDLYIIVVLDVLGPDILGGES